MYASVRTRIAAAVAAAALTGGAAVATASLAGASTGSHPHAKPSATAPAKPAVTKLAISNKRIAHARHHAVAITGVLTAHGAGVAGETVVLEARSGKMPRWHAVASGVTTSTGSVTFTVAPTVKTQYKLVFAGDAHFRASASNVVTLKK